MKKLRIAVIFGGCSPEYRVSLESAYSVILHMDREKYVPVMIGISCHGNWFYFDGEIRRIKEDTWCNERDCVPAVISPNRESRELLLFTSGENQSVAIDAAFPVLHGKNGEDGTVQGLLELAGIPVVGCGILASALSMDKNRAHILARAAGVLVPGSIVLNGGEEESEVVSQTRRLGYPMFVKPVKAGSSYGVTKVDKREELMEAVSLAFQYDDQVMIEEAVEGFEVGCAVIGNDDLLLGEVDEIELSKGFFDFAEKYSLKNSYIHVPARINKEESEKIRQAAKTIYKALGCRGFARVDLFLTPLGYVVFSEVNTIPGFTSHSRFPSMMQAGGITMEEIISRIIDIAVASEGG